MLDLQKITATKKLYEIKMPDGEVLTLKMPTQKMYNTLMELQNLLDNPIEAMNAIYGLLVDIFNLNTQGKVFTIEDINSMLDLSTAIIVIQDYIVNTTQILGE